MKLNLKDSRFHIKKNDNVIVISGDERGKTGKVLKVEKKRGGVIIERVNFIKRHVRPGHPLAPQGGIIEKEATVKVSKIMLVCPKCNRPVRANNERMGKSKGMRVCPKCNEQIE